LHSITNTAVIDPTLLGRLWGPGSGVPNHGEGGASAPQKFWFGENLGKIPENLA